jgi:ATP-dependent DNA helicase RecG
MFEVLQKLVADGDQVAIIYPRVEQKNQKQGPGLLAAVERWERVFPGNVVAVHGGMTADEKSHAMGLAKSNQRRCVLATSLLEIGVTLKGLRAMIVVAAETYGVSTLHQMRGRVARNGGSGYFYLYCGSGIEEPTLARLRMVEQVTNGFELAELDMRARGFGSFLQDMDEESGMTRTLFRGIDLSPHDFE